MQLDRLKEALVGVVESILVELADRRVDYRALYPGKVVKQASDGTLEVRPDDERLGSSITKVPIRTPAPDIVITVQPGARVLVGFEAGKPSEPYASLWQSGAIVSIAIGGDTDAPALASKVDALEAAYNAHIHVTTATIGASATVGVLSPTTSQATGTPYGSTKLLLGG
jgi:hypothetical protein